jgi:predicted DNA-binding transcriptional regulator AlpA
MRPRKPTKENDAKAKEDSAIANKAACAGGKAHKTRALRRRLFRKTAHIAAKEDDDPAEPPWPASQEILLTDRDLEERTGVKVSTWQKRRIFGGGPPFVRMGRMVRYRRSDFEAWIAELPTLRSTSQVEP